MRAAAFGATDWGHGAGPGARLLRELWRADPSLFSLHFAAILLGRVRAGPTTGTCSCGGADLPGDTPWCCVARRTSAAVPGATRGRCDASVHTSSCDSIGNSSFIRRRRGGATAPRLHLDRRATGPRQWSTSDSTWGWYFAVYLRRRQPSRGSVQRLREGQVAVVHDPGATARWREAAVVGAPSRRSCALSAPSNAAAELRERLSASTILRLGAPAGGIPRPVAHALRGPSRAAAGKGVPEAHAEPRGASGEHGEHGPARPSAPRARR